MDDNIPTTLYNILVLLYYYRTERIIITAGQSRTDRRRTVGKKNSTLYTQCSRQGPLCLMTANRDLVRSTLGYYIIICVQYVPRDNICLSSRGDAFNSPRHGVFLKASPRPRTRSLPVHAILYYYYCVYMDRSAHYYIYTGK